VARLELVTTLRELGVSLAEVRRVLGGQLTAAEVAVIHLEALDTEIRALRLRRAVVAAVVKRWPLREAGGLLKSRAFHPGRSARAHLAALTASNSISQSRVAEVLEIAGLGPVARKRAGQSWSPAT
jgi:DNA-binding transcriptional MerR regulator